MLFNNYYQKCYVEWSQFALTHPSGRKIRWQDCLHSGILSFHRLRRNFIKILTSSIKVLKLELTLRVLQLNQPRKLVDFRCFASKDPVRCFDATVRCLGQLWATRSWSWTRHCWPRSCLCWRRLWGLSCWAANKNFIRRSISALAVSQEAHDLRIFCIVLQQFYKTAAWRKRLAKTVDPVGIRACPIVFFNKQIRLENSSKHLTN